MPLVISTIRPAEEVTIHSGHRQLSAGCFCETTSSKLIVAVYLHCTRGDIPVLGISPPVPVPKKLCAGRASLLELQLPTFLLIQRNSANGKRCRQPGRSEAHLGGGAEMNL
ncbi:unnamed protein product [Linum trigynum]|uniref:Uncharacterized protein n=1 Tax=Linum trigynum TaxID=586398 RepID=A0AAV2CJZ2_9ROSI